MVRFHPGWGRSATPALLGELRTLQVLGLRLAYGLRPTATTGALRRKRLPGGSPITTDGGHTDDRLDAGRLLEMPDGTHNPDLRGFDSRPCNPRFAQVAQQAEATGSNPVYVRVRIPLWAPDAVMCGCSSTVEQWASNPAIGVRLPVAAP